VLPSPPHRWRRRLAIAGAVLAVIVIALGIGWSRWMAQGAELGRTHAKLETSHPGWSFPARIYSQAVPLDGLSPKRRVAEAKVRGYTENCFAKEEPPGTFCEKSKRVIPRAGDVLEPVLLGMLIGPDGELRTHLPIADAPKPLIDAILASEDRDFRSHSGVSFTALVRAVFANSKDGQYSQGGSTLTMQVVRNLSQRSEKKVSRKLREMAFAMGLDSALGKDGVLQMYLDAPYLGQRGTLSICGFSEAARHYFGKEVGQLDLAQTATLVAILPGPGKLAPDRNPDACRARRDRLLLEMEKQYGYDVKAAIAAPIVLAPPAPLPERFPAYLSTVRAKLEAQLPRPVVYGAGLTVVTSIDLVMQQEAETLFAAKTKSYEGLVNAKPGTLQTVGIALDVHTGALLALYGGSGVTVSSFNRATQAHRQPGSAFKPLVYALAFSTKGYTAASTQPNSPREFKTPAGRWRPTNVGGEATVTACLAEGLAWSQNIATASLLEQLGGPQPLIDFAKKCGFDTTAFPVEMGLALGQAEVTPLEMAQFVALIANGGRRVEGTPIVRAVDAAGAERLGPPKPGELVLDPTAAALTRDLMRLVIDHGTGGATRGAGGEAGYAGPAMGKTGTTDSEKDLWFVGATPKIATVVWVGFDLPARIGASAADLAAPLWGWWMGKSTQYDAPPLPDFPKEPVLVKQDLCTETGKRPNGSCRVISAPFVPGTTPKQTCEVEHPVLDVAAHSSRESLWKRKAREAAEALDAGPTEAEPAPLPLE
jgi:membrane peptidoglycan carboxypeptidase